MFDRSRTDRVAPDFLLDEIDRNGLSEADYGCFGDAIDESVRDTFQTCYGGGVNDRSTALCDHTREERFYHPKHRTYVERHTKVPIVFSTIVDGAGVNEPGAIEKYVDWSSARRTFRDQVGSCHIQLQCLHILQFEQSGFIDISRDHLRAFPRKRF